MRLRWVVIGIVTFVAWTNGLMAVALVLVMTAAHSDSAGTSVIVTALLVALALAWLGVPIWLIVRLRRSGARADRAPEPIAQN